MRVKRRGFLAACLATTFVPKLPKAEASGGMVKQCAFTAEWPRVIGFDWERKANGDRSILWRSSDGKKQLIHLSAAEWGRMSIPMLANMLGKPWPVNPLVMLGAPCG